MSGSHAPTRSLPFRPGVLSSLLSYWDRTTCHVTYSPGRDAPRPGPPTSSRHYRVGPTTTVGATIRVTEPPPYLSALGRRALSRRSRLRQARTEGAWTDDLVYAHDPRHVAAAVPLATRASMDECINENYNPQREVSATRLEPVAPNPRIK